jgi:hypothetical protein
VEGGALMDNSSYVTVLILGTALVFVDGQIIYRSGLRYLANSHGEPGSARSMARLVSVLFHLAVLGILAIISTIDIAADTRLEGIVVRLGVVLVMLAIAHAVTISVLTRMRDRLDVESVTQSRMQGSTQREPTVTPVYPEENTYGTA